MLTRLGLHLLCMLVKVERKMYQKTMIAVIKNNCTLLLQSRPLNYPNIVVVLPAKLNVE